MIQTTYEVGTGPYGLAKQVHVRELDGMGELISYAQSIQDDPDYRRDCASYKGDYDFTGTHSLKEAIHIATYGWERGRDRLEKHMSTIDTAELIGTSILPRAVFSEAGEEPDISRYLANEPDNMIDYEWPPRPNGKLIELIVGVSQSAGVSSESIMRRGAVIAAVVKRLQTNGYSVGLTAAEASVSDLYESQKVEYYVPIMRPGADLDIDALVFATAHPSFLRRLLFAVSEQEPQHIRTEMGFYIDGGYGRPSDLEFVPPAEHKRVIIEHGAAMGHAQNMAQRLLDGVLHVAKTGERVRI